MSGCAHSVITAIIGIINVVFNTEHRVARRLPKRRKRYIVLRHHLNDFIPCAITVKIPACKFVTVFPGLSVKVRQINRRSVLCGMSDVIVVGGICFAVDQTEIIAFVIQSYSCALNPKIGITLNL